MAIYLEDKKLVKRLLAGDERAFKQFFDENFPRLYRFSVTDLKTVGFQACLILFLQHQEPSQRTE